MMRPTYNIEIDGRELKESIKSRLGDITLTDESEMSSDRLSFSINDSNSDLAIPEPGSRVVVSLGYNDENTIMGYFKVDEVSLTGPSGLMAISASSMDTNSRLKEIRDRDYVSNILGDVVRRIASENSLRARISDEASSIELAKIPIQSKESDANFLSRVCKDNGCALKVNDDSIIIFLKGSGKTISGRDLPVIKLTEEDVTSWEIRFTGRARFSKVVAKYHDVSSGTTVPVEVGGRPPIYTFTKVFPDEATARQAAKSRLSDQTFDSNILTITMPATEKLRAQTVLDLAGFRDRVNGRWTIKTATHTINHSGWTVTLSCQPYIKKE